MIRVYTKDRHIEKITKFLNSINLKYEIFTDEIEKDSTRFELGISYCYPKKISKHLLSIPKKGFINYHPGPLPEYKGPSEYENAIRNKEIKWGVTVHHMNEEFDSGKILQVRYFDLHEPANSIEELGAVSHYFLFNLFKDTIKKIYENN